MLAAAAPHYDFSAADLKPWHMKATYQLYDEQGNPTQQGKYEYWWASPDVHHSSWTRLGMTRDIWHIVGGKQSEAESGERPQFFETRLEAALQSPLPGASDIAPEWARLDRQAMPEGKGKFQCVMVVPNMPAWTHAEVLELGLFPTYCFDPNVPALRLSWSAGAVTFEYNKIVVVQGRYLAKEIVMFEGRRKLMSAEVDSINGIAPTDANLIPPAAPPDVKLTNTVAISAGVAVGMLMKKEAPVYPQDAKSARVSGTVVLRALIGTDGAVHELRVVSAPWPSLAASALVSVSKWQYKPYLLFDKPVDVETTINVIYHLGN
jgi:TonB family protein